MNDLSEVLQKFLQNPIDESNYRPPRWESPIEKSLWSALRHIGIWIETQVPIGPFRIDMLAASRMNKTTLIIECDGAEYHHPLIDEFRDDELVKIARVPIAHVYGSKIVRSPEDCALQIVERWFPEHTNTLGYVEALEIAEKSGIEHLDGARIFIIGQERPLSGIYVESSNEKVRELVRYVTGTKDDHLFTSEEQKHFFSAIRQQLDYQGLTGRKLTPQELARAYIIIRYEEPDRSIELEKFDAFLNGLKLKSKVEFSL